jgi:predicted exporter
MIPRHWVATLVWGIVLGAAGFVVLTKTQVKTDLSLLFPPARTHTQQLLLNEVREGPTSRLILIGLEGTSTKALASASKKLAAWMRESGEFVYVANGDQAWSTEGMDLFFRYRYLLSPLVTETRFEQVGLRRALQDRLRDLTSPLSAMVKGAVSEDPTGEFRAVLQSWMPEVTPRRYHGVWFSARETRVGVRPDR